MSYFLKTKFIYLDKIVYVFEKKYYICLDEISLFNILVYPKNELYCLKGYPKK